MNTEFKIGDHVEFLGGKDYSAKRGARAVVVGVGRYLDVVWETMDARHGNQADGGYDPGDFVRMKMINRGEYKSMLAWGYQAMTNESFAEAEMTPKASWAKIERKLLEILQYYIANAQAQAASAEGKGNKIMTINYIYSIGSIDYVTETYAEALKARQYTFRATGKLPTIYRFDADATKIRYVEVPDTAVAVLA